MDEPITVRACGVMQNCIHTPAQSQFTYSILSCLTGEQLDAALRLLLWLSADSTRVTEAQLQAELARVVAGDRRFAETLSMAMQSIRTSSREICANDKRARWLACAHDASAKESIIEGENHV